MSQAVVCYPQDPLESANAGTCESAAQFECCVIDKAWQYESPPKSWHCDSKSLSTIHLPPPPVPPPPPPPPPPPHSTYTTDHSLPHLPLVVFKCNSLQLLSLLLLSHDNPHTSILRLLGTIVYTLRHSQQETRSSAATLFRYVGPMFLQHYESVASLVSSPCGLPRPQQASHSRCASMCRGSCCSEIAAAILRNPINSNAANTTSLGSFKNTQPP